MFGLSTTASPFGAVSGGSVSTGAPLFGGSTLSTGAITAGFGGGFSFTNPVSQQQQQQPQSIPLNLSFGQPSQPVSQAPSSQTLGLSFPSTSTTGVSGVGLGGVDTVSLGPSVLSSSSGTSNIGKPKDTIVPPELMALVDLFKKTMKENKDNSDAIGSSNLKVMSKLDSDVLKTSLALSKSRSELQKVVGLTKTLKEQIRQDLKMGEVVARIQESPAGLQQECTVPYEYLLGLTTQYEAQLDSLSQYVNQLERRILRQSAPTIADIGEHLKRFDAAARHIAARVYNLHEVVDIQKEAFLRYRKNSYGDARNPFALADASNLKSAAPKRFEGPSPFQSTSTGAIVAIAHALNRGYSGAPINPYSIQPVAPTQVGVASVAPFSFSSPVSVPSQQQQQLNIGLNPFGASAATAPATSAAFSGFGTSGALFSSPSIAVSSAPVASTVPFRFSSPFNTASSGTLFGGSATAVRPLGIVSPLAATTPATTDQTSVLQLQNPPLGSKRGKK